MHHFNGGAEHLTAGQTRLKLFECAAQLQMFRGGKTCQSIGLTEDTSSIAYSCLLLSCSSICQLQPDSQLTKYRLLPLWFQLIVC